MMQEGSLEFPPYQDLSFDLPASEENRENRVQYARLPFRLLKPGNHSKASTRTFTLTRITAGIVALFSSYHSLPNVSPIPVV